jgi:cyclase
MLKHRLIPVVLLRDGNVVQSKGFKRFQALGNPTMMVQRLSDWAADELIYLDISRAPVHAQGRRDLGVSSATEILSILRDVARCCFMPLSFGGGLRTVRDMEQRLDAGADKVVLNTQALRDPGLIEQGAREFGSQAIVVSIDAKAQEPGAWKVALEGGRDLTSRSPADWAREAEGRGAGEILINSIDRDGSGQGYDLPLVRSVTRAVTIPVIACGGVGRWEHLAEGVLEGGASAVAAANIFHYTENSVFHAKQFLAGQGLPFRRPVLGWGAEPVAQAA